MMIAGKTLMGLVFGGISVAGVAIASSLGALTSTSSQQSADQTTNSDTVPQTNPKSDLPSYITLLRDCYKISPEQQTKDTELIFCTDSKFYLYGADKSVTQIKSVKVTGPTSITIEIDGEQTEKNKVFSVEGAGWGSVVQNKELNEGRVCQMSHVSDSVELALICEGNQSNPIKLPQIK